MKHPALKYQQTIATKIAEYTIEIWGKTTPEEKHRSKHKELALLQEFHPNLQCGFLEQVHGNRAQEVSPETIADNLAIADAVFTQYANIICCVRTADCIPLLGFSEERPLCFAIHAGWRGLYSGIIPATLEKIKEKFFLSPASLKIFVGPHILQNSYETSQEVFSKFDLSYTKIKSNGKGYLDLTAIAYDQLQQNGILAKNIISLTEDTLGSVNFFSHRGGDSGRNLNLIYYKT